MPESPLSTPVSGPSAARGATPERASREAFGALLASVRAEVDQRLAALFEGKLAEARRHGPDVEAMVEAVRDLTMRGGKRFRPALLLAGLRAADATAPAEIAHEAGVALELLQTYLLVHDDWMDQDDVRRGGPSVHAMLIRRFGERHAGESAAILAGDWAAATALEAMARAPAAPERLPAAMVAFARIQQDAICGQQLDLAGRPEDVEAMHDLKTGSYTVRGPLQLGATLGGAPPAVAAALDRFARPLGVAFQLRDDLLGAFGDPGETGKPSATDVRAGKRTMLLTEALARADEAGRRAIERVVGRRGATDDEVARVVELFESTGARRAVESRLDALVASAAQALEGAPIADDGRACLLGAAAALTARRS